MSDEDIPVVYKVPDTGDDILKYKADPQFASSTDYPNFALGFHHFIHQSKGNMSITNQFKNKKRVYLVMNKYERYVDDYETDIGSVSKVYFDISPKPDILSRAFYKLWELFYMFDLIPSDGSNFVSAHLAEGPGSFIQATMFWRDKFAGKTAKNDKYHAVTLHSEETGVPKLHEDFIKFYKKEKPQRFTQHETFTKKSSGTSKSKDNGDITLLKTIKNFSNGVGSKGAHLVTADGGFNWKNENLQEQEAFKLILGEVLAAVRVQAKGGNFVLKIFESFTNVTLKIICLLKSFYGEVFIAKPLMSRPSNSEKYIICLGFKGDKGADKIEDVLKGFNYEEKRFLVDIFPEFELTKEFKSHMTRMNTEISNRQFMRMNEIIDFINKQNYRGDVYQKRRKLQIQGSEMWTSRFFPLPKEHSSNMKKVRDDTTKLANDNAKDAAKFNEILNE